MDARGFSPEDIKVKITETAVLLDGVHETEDEIIEFNEEIDIPELVLPATIEVLMNGNGVLRIRAPIQSKEYDMRATIVREETRTETIKTKTIHHTYNMDMEIKVTRVSESEGAKTLADKKFKDSTKDLINKDGKLEVSTLPSPWRSHYAKQTVFGFFQLNLDMGGHRVEDIKVTVSEKVLAIQALAHHEIENGPKEIHRKYLIPDGVDPSSFRALLKKNGTMTVTAEPVVPEPKKKEEAPLPPPPPPPKVPTLPPSAANEPITYCWIKSLIVEDPKEIEELTAKCEDITAEVAKVDAKKFEVSQGFASRSSPFPRI